MRILGISAYYHDSAAALVEDGRILAAVQEERFSRKRHNPAFPRAAIQFCLEEGRTRLDEIDHVVFYDKPFAKFERLLETYLAFAPRGFESFRTAMPVWLKEKLLQKKVILDALKELAPDAELQKRLLFTEHHQAHAASAFFPSPFEKAVVLTLDGVGEWTTTSAALGEGNSLRVLREIHFPHSIGLLYSAFTYYTGFKVNSAEYKVMGLAPYGTPVYKDLILEKLIDLKDDGSFRLDLSYFDYCIGLRMTNRKFAELFGGPARAPDEPLTQKQMDLAASVQAVTEEIVLRLTRALAKETGIPNLCLAGGVALNCVANGKVLRDGSFERVWIQPAAGDAGGALGAALSGYYQFHQRPRVIAPQSRKAQDAKDAQDAMQGSYLGPEYSQAEIELRLLAAGARFQTLEEDPLLEATAQAIEQQCAIGWFQGRMEFGPRALGARSILADARSPAMQKKLNLKVKFRESFRPFAPIVPREDVSEWFELDCDSPYMLFVAKVARKLRIPMSDEQQKLFGIDRLNVPRSTIPAATHIDFSARIQTVHQKTHPRLHKLLKLFQAKTGCPVLVNTSFNVRGEPIVCTPEDAFRCFMGTDLDLLVIGNSLLRKEDQDPALRKSYASEIVPD